jgi:UDP-N-acetylmuramoyl-L-alanyl-D-glutamate--2,6-diaminopimelate ligase
MKVKELLGQLGLPYEYVATVDAKKNEEAGELVIIDLTADSRQVRSGSIFFAMSGVKADGHAYVPMALEKGAAAVIIERVDPSWPHTERLIKVSSVRQFLLASAQLFYGFSSEKMAIFGVTGTNGKTSSTFMLQYILSRSGKDWGIIGTLGHRFRHKEWATEHTTPDALILQRRLAEMLKEGASGVAMEVSSHALDQERVGGVHFNTVLFTNLTRDHLDYHATMENYFLAKQKLFTECLWDSKKRPLFAVVNIDDKWGRKLRIRGDVILWTFAQNRQADFRYQINNSTFEGINYSLTGHFGQFSGWLPLVGGFNLTNAVGVIAVALSFGVPIAASIRALESFSGVPGRMQRVQAIKNKFVFVDYAHTPDALQKALSVLRDIRAENKMANQIICVFGCGGDRDPGKRPIMGEIAATLADKVIITNDNPRTEEPEKIADQIVKGAKNKSAQVFLELDRQKAIALAGKGSAPGDVILIAGKGHEDYQIIGTEKTAFSDILVAEKELAF